MSTTLRTPMSLEAFLAWEARQPLKHEFDGVQPVAMTGVTIGHSAIQRNLITALASRLRGGPCQVHGSDVKIRAAGSIRYPDAFIVCSPLPRDATVVSEPVIVFEILSPSTSSVDRIVKNREYRDTPSIRRYVILEQDRMAATVFAWDHGDWVGHVLAEEADLNLPEIGISVTLSELYEDVMFADPPEET